MAPISINGSGTVTGISVGGLPDGTITGAELNGAQTGTAPIYGCRAWVNFDGTRNEADTGASTNGANVKIRASGNVTSVLKNATGNYTITFATPMPDANYSLSGYADISGTKLSVYGASLGTLSASTINITVATGGGTTALSDATQVHISIFR
jgi:hypothetical protein